MIYFTTAHKLILLVFVAVYFHIFRSPNDIFEGALSDAVDCLDRLQVIFMNARKAHCFNKLTLKLPTQDCCIKFYNDKIVTNNHLQIAAESKSNKTLWEKERQFRITGSRCYGLFTYQKDNWEEKAFKYFWPKGFFTK